MRQLIVNADDFGQSHGINRGVIEAHERGIVTSSSLMVRWPGAKEAADYGRAHPDFTVGLHLDLAEWMFRDGSWTRIYEVVRADDTAAVRDEVYRQLDKFRDLLDCEPTHLDSHQHRHRDEPAHSIIRLLADELGIPCRGYSAINYCGDFYGQTLTGKPYPEAISAEALLRLLTQLPAGITELACHPGYEAELTSTYSHERVQELGVLCDLRVQKTIEREGIMLCSFNKWRAGAVPAGGLEHD